MFTLSFVEQRDFIATRRTPKDQENGNRLLNLGVQKDPESCSIPPLIYEVHMMRARVLILVGGLSFSSHGQARSHFFSPHPICTTQLDTPQRRSQLASRSAWPGGLFVDGFIWPGILHVHQEVCRCLPRRKRHQPPIIRADLNISPNKGEVHVTYRIDGPQSRPTQRMMACLGEPTLSVEPMAYVSDMITQDGRAEEILVYPIKMVLDD